jgi:hypothetical protein
MSWTIDLSDDLDTTGNRTVTATWTDPTLGAFTVSGPVRAVTADMNQAIAYIIAKRNAWKTKQTTAVTRLNTFLAALIAADV